MSEVPSRDDVISALKAALKVVPPEKVGDPSNIYGYAYTDNIPEFRKADQLYENWHKTEEEKSKSPEEKLKLQFDTTTIYVDAGFTDPDYLDEVANDWLENDATNAEEQGFTELAIKINSKIDEINKHLDEA